MHFLRGAAEKCRRYLWIAGFWVRSALIAYFFFSAAGEQMGLVGSFHEIDVIYGHVRCIYETEREFWKWERNMG